MEEKGLARRLEKGKYILNEDWESLDIYEIASNFLNTSYLAFWSALHFHKITDQVPRTVFIASTKRKRNLQLQRQKIQFVTISRRSFFGYQQYGRVIASDVEKTIIDCLRLPKYSGGIEQVYNAFNERLDFEKMTEYCLKTQSSAVASRLGYLLDQKGVLNKNNKIARIITSYTKLDPLGKEINPNSVWKLYVNRGLK